MSKSFIYNVKVLLLLLLFIITYFPTQAATEIHKSILYHTNDSSYLILHLFNFHATGGSYEQGNLRTAGYNDSEIRVINLQSKKTICHKKFGEYSFKGAFEILGAKNGQIWIYSLEQKSGLQALNLYTLKKEVSQANIYAKMNTWTGRFYLPDWRKINDYYDFNCLSEKLCVSNFKDQYFGLDPKTFEVNDGKKLKKQDRNYLWKVVYEKQDTLDLYDEYIHINNLKQLSNNHFIEGSFIIEQDAKKQYAHFQETLAELSLQNEELSNKLSRIRAKQGSAAYNNLVTQKEWLNSRIKDTKDNLISIEQNQRPDKILLRSNDDGFFVLQRANTNQESTIAIAKVSQNKNNIAVEWTTPIPNMYYNISAVQYMPEFKHYFNNKVPDPSFFYIRQFEQNILIIYLMQICIIDTQTGKISWQTKL